MKTRKANNGNWLTQAELEDEASRTFAKKVCGYGDLDSLFTEWSDEQKAEWEREHLQEENDEGWSAELDDQERYNESILDEEDDV